MVRVQAAQLYKKALSKIMKCISDWRIRDPSARQMYNSIEEEILASQEVSSCPTGCITGFLSRCITGCLRLPLSLHHWLPHPLSHLLPHRLPLPLSHLLITLSHCLCSLIMLSHCTLSQCALSRQTEQCSGSSATCSYTLIQSQTIKQPTAPTRLDLVRALQSQTARCVMEMMSADLEASLRSNSANTAAPGHLHQWEALPHGVKAAAHVPRRRSVDSSQCRPVDRGPAHRSAYRSSIAWWMRGHN